MSVKLLRRAQLRLHLVEQMLDLGAVEPGNIVLVLEQYTERVRHRCRIEGDHIKLGQRGSPVQRLGHARRFEQVFLAQRLHED